MLLRLPAALATAATVAVTGALSRELGADRRAQLLAAVVVATGAVFLGAGHLLGTTVFDLLAWVVLLLLLVRLLRTRDDRLWLPIGVVAGIGLLDSTLVAFLLASVGVGILLGGPRRVLWSPWLVAAAVVAAALWAPYLAWQAGHGWPQLAESRAIAAGQSGTSQPRWQIIPFQLLLVGPWLAPVWMAGLVRLWRDHALRWCRALGLAWVVLAAVIVATGGKGYYLAGMTPLLAAAGAPPALAWLRRRRHPRVVATAALVLTLPAFVVALPVLPRSALAGSGVVGVNYDLGEQVAWPAYVAQIARAYHAHAADAIVTGNYGEAGAVDRYGGQDGLPRAYSGQTGFWYWGPPPATARRVLAVGLDRGFLTSVFRDVRPVGRLDNHLGLDDDEQHAPLWVCTGPRASWPALWPRFRHT
jgi:4-amino-4-deoxy-L-arabinose transferase-like glycosyltransferase